jgi:hypothetical protein
MLARSGGAVAIQSGGAPIQCTSGGEVATNASTITRDGSNIDIKGAQAGNH